MISRGIIKKELDVVSASYLHLFYCYRKEVTSVENPSSWVERALSGKYIPPMSYVHPTKVKERNITKCSVRTPGGFKLSTNK